MLRHLYASSSVCFVSSGTETVNLLPGGSGIERLNLSERGDYRFMYNQGCSGVGTAFPHLFSSNTPLCTVPAYSFSLLRYNFIS